MANTEDIRYKSTESAIRTAFMELAQKDAKRITVTALCKAARISRNAFYLHHPSIAELSCTLTTEIVDDVRTKCLASADKVIASGSFDTALSLSIINALTDHEKVLRTLLPADSGELASRLADGIAESYIDAAMSFGEHGGSLDHRLACSFSAWGLIGFVKRWIATTSNPLSDALLCYEELQHGISGRATDYLLSRWETSGLDAISGDRLP